MRHHWRGVPITEEHWNPWTGKPRSDRARKAVEDSIAEYEESRATGLTRRFRRSAAGCAQADETREYGQ